jgi:methylmalonyl-CoA mutase C-terminal domain/subunit
MPYGDAPMSQPFQLGSDLKSGQYRNSLCLTWHGQEKEDGSMEKRIRVVVAKPGLDGHDRGAKVLSRALRDAGMEVIYTGLRQTPEALLQTCVQEDADVLCMSSLSGAHDYLFPKVTQTFRDSNVHDVLILGGGIIPEEDIAALKESGIEEIFGPGSRSDDIVAYIRTHLKK